MFHIEELTLHRPLPPRPFLPKLLSVVQIDFELVQNHLDRKRGLTLSWANNYIGGWSPPSYFNIKEKIQRGGIVQKIFFAN